ncbi:hypothetical protein K456DRAFT_1914641 [Colletotrichum gloeosporioides 23]|nr:hypothetical protein K456DRAFT_1914641 [Colletotrichum gloeosporioides 23]
MSFLPLFLPLFFFFLLRLIAVDSRKGWESTYPAPPQVLYPMEGRSSIAELPPYQLTSAGDPWGKEKASRSPVVRPKTQELVSSVGRAAGNGAALDIRHRDTEL